MTMSARLVRSVTALFLSAFFISTAQAEEFSWFGDRADGNWLLGLKGASIQNGRVGHEDSSNSALVLGYNFSGPHNLSGSSSLELEFSSAFDEGDILNNGHFGAPGEWKSDTLGLYFTYRSSGSVYFLGKVGALKSDVSTTVGGLELEEQDTSLSYGGGLGLHLGDSGNFNLELEFIGTSGDNDLNMITLGGIYRFE